ncbi:MAG: hypothetical protein ABR529_01095 [Actinomycetota bacterium]
MTREDVDQEGRYRECLTTRTRFRLRHVAQFPADFLEGADDVDLSSEEVEVVSLEAYELAPSTAKVDGGVDKGLVVGMNGAREVLNLFRSKEALLLATEPWERDAAARDRRDEASINCRPHRAGEEPVTFSDGLRRKSLGGKVTHPFLNLER